MGMHATFTPIPAGCVDDVVDDPSRIDRDYGDVAVDADKAWQGIHFLLTGSDWEGDPPLSLMIMGGRELTDDSVRLLSSDEVQQVAATLPMEEVLRARFDPQRMNQLDIYPGIWSEGDAACDYLLEHYGPLADLFRDAAGRGDAIAISIA